MTTVLEGGECTAARPGRSLPPGKTRYPLYRRLGGPHGQSGQVQKVSPPLGFDSWTAQPIASCFNNWYIPALNLFQYNTTITYWLWLRLSTRRDLACSKPSGTSLRLLWLRSSVVNSSKQNSSAGIPELFTRLWRIFSVLKQPSSVSSPYKRSRPFRTSDRCS